MIKKTWLLLGLVFLLSLVSVSAVGTAPSNSIVGASFVFDDLTDDVGSNDFVNTGGASNVGSCIIGNCYRYSSAGSDYMSNNNLTYFIDDGDPNAISFWVKETAGGVTTMPFSAQKDSNSRGSFIYEHIDNPADEPRLFIRNNAMNYVLNGDEALVDNAWVHIVFSFDGSNTFMYVNGTKQSENITSWFNNSGVTSFALGKHIYSSTYFDGDIDELIVFNDSLTDDNVLFLYNNHAPTSDQQFPFVSGGSPEYFTARLTSGSNLSLDWGNGTVLTNSTGSLIVTGILRNDTASLESFTLFSLNRFNISVSNWNTTQDYNFSFVSYPFVNVSDRYDGSAVTGFTVGIDGVNYTDVDADGVVYVPVNVSKTVVLSKAGFISNTSTVDFSGPTDFYGVLYQSIISFNASEVISLDGLSGVTFTVGGNTDNPKYMKAGNYTVTANKTGYYDKNFSFSVSGGDVKTVTVVNMSNVLAVFNLTDVVTGVTLAVPTYVNLTHLGSNNSVLLSGVAGNFSVYLAQGNYSGVFWADNYSFRYENFSLNASVVNVSYGLYANNSVWVYAYDVDSGAQLYTFAVELYDNLTSYEANESGGYASFNNIPSGVYTASVSRSGYVTTTYSVTMTGGSHQTVIAYLTQDTGATSTIFTNTNVWSGIAVEGVTVNQYRTIGGSWTLIASKTSDLTGRTQFSYTSAVEYRFDFIKSGFETRIIYLEPLFSSYSVPLTPDIEGEVDVNVGDWSYLIDDELFYNGVVNNCTVTISSGTGTIEYYLLNVTNFNGSLYMVSCNNSYGCSDLFSLNISGANISHFVNVSYNIKETGRSVKHFTHNYRIQGVYTANTVESWKESDFGSLEKAVVSTVVMLVVCGVVAGVGLLVGAPAVTVTGLALALASFVFARVGFIPNYSAYIIGLGVLLIVIFGRGEV